MDQLALARHIFTHPQWWPGEAEVSEGGRQYRRGHGAVADLGDA
jgi:hypothetical protein